MFKDAKAGDKVWDIRRGWGEVSYIEHTGKYPIFVKFSNYVSGKFSTEGKEFLNDINPTLYWDEFRIIPPKKPLMWQEPVKFDNWHLLNENVTAIKRDTANKWVAIGIMGEPFASYNIQTLKPNFFPVCDIGTIIKRPD